MPGFVTCPNCREELDIPSDLRGRPVRCAACNSPFTPPADDAPPVAPRASRAEPRDNPRDDGQGESDDRPRRRRDFDRPQPRRSNTWLWLILFGSLGLCVVGCGGFIIFAVQFADPTLTSYQAPDGRFQTAFPGPVVVATQPAAKDGRRGATTTYEYRRTIFGQVFDTYLVRSIELPPDTTKAAGRQLVKDVVDELAAEGIEVKRSRSTLDWADATEIQVTYPDRPQEETLIAKVALMGDRIYVVGVRGQAMTDPDEQLRARKFLDQFTAKGEKGIEED